MEWTEFYTGDSDVTKVATVVEDDQCVHPSPGRCPGITTKEVIRRRKTIV